MKKTFACKSVEESKSSFNRLLRRKDYQTIISDDKQRLELIYLLMVKTNGLYLDFACGTGYVSFEIPKNFPAVLLSE